MTRILPAALLATFLATTAQAATPKDALVMAWNLDALITFDPAQIGEVNGNDIILGNVCTPLMQFDSADLTKLLPNAAESWSAAPDGMSITFKLRPDLKFPDGRPATAEDAAWSIQRVVTLGFGNSATLTQWGYTKDNVAQLIRAEGDHTLVVGLTKPYPAELILSAIFAGNTAVVLDRATAMKNAKTVDGASDLGNAAFKTGPACVGPYKVSRWNANEVVILERNETFFGEKPKLRRVIIRHVPESSAERLLLEQGDIDVARLLNADDLKALASNKDVAIVETLVQGMTYINSNTDDPVLAKPQVREALRYLIDYDALGATILQYQGKPRASVVPFQAFGALDEKAGQPFKLDLARAKQLVTEAGYPDGFTTKLILSANGVSPQLAQHVASNAAKVGVKIELEQMADSNLFTRGRNRDYQLQLVGWYTGYPDADAMMFRQVVNPDPRPEAKLTMIPVWRTGWQSLEMNKAAEEARMEHDPAKRIADYARIQDYMMHNGPAAYIYQPIRPLAMRNTVKGFVISPFFVNYGSATK